MERGNQNPGIATLFPMLTITPINTGEGVNHHAFANADLGLVQCVCNGLREWGF
ncbi:Unknown protein sequence [Pseudomonas amygdali pv. lachrymans]|uniref:Uncharacterized protein n=1 Tax=Pseudomonas amygdali pv. lachrymans TaxID=53707 RepID=A0ABR5KS77_PSEAV|nr:Unknown protein sequence [Pseudomonas amygdali pv. lachrymans]